ncbi:MAG: hypothetical protein KatS3mg129_3052 [Leptospiraceae bacterium]|nr:MAG: hypothetical protein KatS3mg129_3052 [Leptospiraceae bacterium]
MDWKFIIFSGGPIVLILFLLLIIVLIIIVERIFFYNNYKKFLSNLEEKLNSQQSIRIQDLSKFLYDNNKIISSNWFFLLNQLEEKKEIDECFLQFYNKEILLLEKYLIYLATLGNLSPFIGLLGTVFGIIRSFMHLGETNMVEINRGIAEALIATAIGLIVAIPSSFGYNLFRKTVEEIEIQLETIQNLLMTKIKNEE